MIRLLSIFISLFILSQESAAQELPQPPAPEAVDAPVTVKLYPAPLQTKERLRRLIVELWCAERRGADDEALMRLYLKHSYPSLQDWHKVWNRTIQDSAWVRKVYDEVRETCPAPEDKVPLGVAPSQ